MSIEEFIANEVKSNDVVLFMKGTPQFPQCGFSGQVVQILDHVGVGYKGLNVLESAELRNGIKEYSNWPTRVSPSARRPRPDRLRGPDRHVAAGSYCCRHHHVAR